MDKKILKVCMLGSFSLEYAGKELVLDRNKNSKTTQLFQLLIKKFTAVAAVIFTYG